jgi:uncharacterized protein YtpQ (UPF0354 family)
VLTSIKSCGKIRALAYGGSGVVNKESFINRFCNDLKKLFDSIKVKDNNIYIIEKGMDIYIPVEDIYREYMMINDYKVIKEKYIQLIKNEILRCNHKIDTSTIIPVIRRKDFAGRNDKMFVKKNLGADINIYYAEDRGELLRYITYGDLENNNLDLEEVEKIATENINRFGNTLVPMDNEIKVFGLKFENEIGISVFLTDAIQKQINKIGKNRGVLIGFPNETMFLVAEDNKFYFDIMQDLAKYGIHLEKSVSDKIYRYKNGKLQFADIGDLHLKVVK